MRRFYLNELRIVSGKVYELSPEESHHLAVLRFKAGDPIAVFNNTGHEWVAEVVALTTKKASVLIKETISPPAPEPSIEIILASPMTDQHKMEFIVEKCTELGVSTLLFYCSTRSRSHKPVATLSALNMRRLSRKAIEAVKQCGRGKSPYIKASLLFDEVVGQTVNSENTLKILAWEKSTSPLMQAFLSSISLENKNCIFLLIGPEGGFEYDEVERACNADFTPCSLGTRILKLETAVIASLSLILGRISEM